MKKGVMILIFLLVSLIIIFPLKSTGATGELPKVEIDPLVIEKFKSQSEAVRN